MSNGELSGKLDALRGVTHPEGQEQHHTESNHLLRLG